MPFRKQMTTLWAWYAANILRLNIKLPKSGRNLIGKTGRMVTKINVDKRWNPRGWWPEALTHTGTYIYIIYILKKKKARVAEKGRAYKRQVNNTTMRKNEDECENIAYPPGWHRNRAAGGNPDVWPWHLWWQARPGLWPLNPISILNPAARKCQVKLVESAKKQNLCTAICESIRLIYYVQRLGSEIN